MLLQIKKRGGTCVPVQCDHENDKDIENLFKQIENEEKGQLDILVNSAFKGGNVDEFSFHFLFRSFLLSNSLTKVFVLNIWKEVLGIGSCSSLG